MVIHVVGNPTTPGFSPLTRIRSPQSRGMAPRRATPTRFSPLTRIRSPQSIGLLLVGMALSCFSPLTRIRCAQPLMTPHRAGVPAPKGVQSEAEYNPAGELAAGLGVAAAWRESGAKGMLEPDAGGVGEWVG